MTTDHLIGACMVLIVAGVAYAARCVWEAARAMDADQRARSEAEE
jgi:hypothetical protein